MKRQSWLGRYASHPDPATAAANLVALVVAGNGPFYPVYVLLIIGWDRTGAWLTMLATPLFFAVPALARRGSRIGRVALPAIGIANTVWCGLLFGGASGVGLFMLPCLILAALLARRAERLLLLALLGLGLVALAWLTEWPPHGLLPLSPDQAAGLTRLNTLSVATLTGFLALRLAGLLRGAD